MSDDNNDNDEPTGENQGAEIIDISEARDAEKAGEEMFEKGKTVITDIFQNVMERLQETAQKASDPSNPRSVAHVFDEARKRAQSGKNALDDVAKKKVVNLAAERLKRRGESEVDLKSVFGDQLKDVAREYAKVDEDGNVTLNIDGDFISEHGAEVIPELVSRLARAFVESITGDVDSEMDTKATADDLEAAGEVPKPDKEDAPEDTGDVDVKLDILGVVGALFTAASEAARRGEAEEALEDAEATLAAVPEADDDAKAEAKDSDDADSEAEADDSGDDDA